MRVFRLIAHYLANTGRFYFPGFLHSPRFSPQPSFSLPFSRPSSLPHSFPFCTRVARISSGTIVAVKCFSPWKDIVLLSACLYNLGNAIFPRTDISTPPLSSHVHTKGAPVDGGRVVDPSVRSCSWSFPEFYRRIRRERENSRGHRRLLRNVGGSEKDPTRWRIRGEGHLPISSPEKRSPLSRRVRWPLGEGGLASVFLLQHTSKQVRCTHLWIFLVNSVKRRMWYNLRENEKFLYRKKLLLQHLFESCLPLFIDYKGHSRPRVSSLEEFSGSFQRSRKQSPFVQQEKALQFFLCAYLRNPVPRRPLTRRINLPKRVDLSGWRISI